ncbi:MAG TPA: hypothetical protein VIK99_06150 [Thermaerobacter sp.]
MVLEWLAHCKLATAQQIQQKAGMPSKFAVYQRMKQLQDAGYVAHMWVLRGEPGVYVATRQALRTLGLPLPPASIDLRMYRRDVLVVDLALRYGEEGWEVYFERTLRYWKRQEEGTCYGIPLEGSSQPHYPALLLFRPGSCDPERAVEVHLANPGHPRRRRLLAAYADAPYDLDYWVPSRTARAVQEDVEALGLSHKVTVRTVEDVLGSEVPVLSYRPAVALRG